jgi:hypothetical protein
MGYEGTQINDNQSANNLILNDDQSFIYSNPNTTQ